MATFDNYHLAISKETFGRKGREGFYNCESRTLHIEEHRPDYNLFVDLLDRYGSPWGWDRRPKYYNNRQEIEKRLGHPETRLMTLHDGEREIGYCLAVGMNSSLSAKFWERANGHKVMEIENFALSVDENGQGKGQYFLQEILRDLLQEADSVYLSSRSTNHRGVIPFYQKMGMSVFHVERDLPDDLMPVIKAPSRDLLTAAVA